jgi:DNA polymerase-3 subunit epsilon
MRLSHQIRRLEWHQTAGEVGALLLEARMVKDMQPVHNRQLRRERELCAWHLRPNTDGHVQPIVIYASEHDFGSAERLYGLFRSRRKAETALRGLAESHELCLVMLGLESRARLGKPCFAHQLRRCRGACVGKEAAAEHQQRLEDALAGLKVNTWPYAGAAGLVEMGVDGREDVHVVNNWCWLGSASSDDEVRRLLQEAPVRPAFDIDTYRILLRGLTTGAMRVRELAVSSRNGRKRAVMR